MDKSTRTAWLARAALLVATVIWGSSFVVMKQSVDVFPPHYLLAFRFTASALILALVLHRRLKTLDRSFLWRGLLIGAMLFVAYSLQTLGLMQTTPGKNAFLTAVYCVIVPFLFWAVNKTRPDRYTVAAALLCIVGVGLVSLSGEFSVGAGDALTLLGGFVFAVHMVAVAVLGRGRDPLLLTMLQFGGAAACAWAVALCSESFPTAESWTLQSVGGLLYLTLFATCLALSFQIFGLHHMPPAAAAVLMSLESVFGVLFSVLCGERLTLQVGCGFVLIFVAILTSETKWSFLHRRS